MAITKNSDYFTQAKGRLTQQFKGLPRIEGFLQAVSAEAQELENNMWLVFFDRCIQNGVATDDLLDKLGKLVGQRNEGLSDAQFRILIQARIAANRSNGKREELIYILSVLAPGVPIYVKDFPPASVFIEARGPVPVPANLIAISFLEAAVAAGVLLAFSWTAVSWATTIIWGSAHGGTAPTTTQSFGTAHGGTPGGGVCAGVFEIYGGAQ